MTGISSRTKQLILDTLELVRSARKIRRQPLTELEALPTLEAVVEFGRAHDIECFNGQVLRTRWVLWLISTLGVTHFLETGTFLAASSVTICRRFGIPTYSVDIASRFVRRARILSLAVLGPRSTRYHLRRGDSRVALRDWLAELPESAVPLVFLDAHSNAIEDQPLRDEFRLCLERGRCVALIDDFRVPWDSDFGFDSAHGFDIGLDSLYDLLSDDRVEIYLPAYEARLESGYRRGAAAALIDLSLEPDGYPANLFRRVTDQALHR